MEKKYPSHHPEYRKKYRQENKEKTREYLDANRERNNKKRNEHRNKRMKEDLLFRLQHLFKNKVRGFLKGKGFKKNNKTQDILGCSFEEFKIHIEKQFQPWMTWENRGLYNGTFNYGWDLDHIIPINTAITEEEIIRLNHYSNFQPLCSKVNREIKRDNIEKLKTV